MLLWLFCFIQISLSCIFHAENSPVIGGSCVCGDPRFDASNTYLPDLSTFSYCQWTDSENSIPRQYSSVVCSRSTQTIVAFTECDPDLCGQYAFPKNLEYVNVSDSSDYRFLKCSESDRSVAQVSGAFCCRKRGSTGVQYGLTLAFTLVLWCVLYAILGVIIVVCCTPSRMEQNPFCPACCFRVFTMDREKNEETLAESCQIVVFIVSCLLSILSVAWIPLVSFGASSHWFGLGVYGNVGVGVGTIFGVLVSIFCCVFSGVFALCGLIPWVNDLREKRRLKSSTTKVVLEDA